MAASEFLEINRFSSEGEKMRSLRCLAGRVSVFRSRTEDELQLYRQAIEGTNTQDSLTLSLDGVQFNPKEHIYIGFGARDDSPTSKTVATYLTEWGITEDVLELNLIGMGLQNTIAQRLCSSLSPVEWRMVRQIACLKGTTNRSVFFLNDPFLEFTNEAKEQFAEHWTSFAWRQKKIIIVTRLSERPECWIENDFIARIQLERPRQATIGFGGGETSGPSAYEIKKLRAALTEKETLTAVAKRSWLNQQLHNPVRAAIGIFSFVLIVGTSVLMTRLFSSKDEMVAVSSPTTKFASVGASTSGSVASNGTSKDQTSPSIEQSDGLIHANNSLKLVDHFPDDIQLAWSTAMEHPESLLQIGFKKNSKNSTENDGQNSDNSTDQFKVFFDYLSQ